MPSFRRCVATGVFALAALACTRDYDTLFSEADLGGDGGGPRDVADAGPVLDSQAESATAGDAAADVCTACTGGACTIACASACPCSPRACAGPECNFVCHPSPLPCVVENTSAAANATTTVTCKAGSTCDVTCQEPPCSVICEGTAQCKMTCLNAGSGDECVLSCAGGTLDTSCDNSGGALRRSCNTSCPPPI